MALHHTPTRAVLDRTAHLLAAGAFATGIALPSPASSDVPEDLAELVDRTLQESDYGAVWQIGTPFAGVDAAWQAPNLANGMRTYFLEDGVHVEPRSAGPDGRREWSLGLRLGAVGRGGERQLLPDGPVSVDGNLVVYARGGVAEWYINDERGLEQGFDIAERPLAARPGALELWLDVEGGLQPQLTPSGRAVVFTDGEVPLLTFGGLFAHDADHKPLATRFEARGGQLAIVVADEDARYPIVVDPTLVTEETAFVTTGEPNLAQFGASVDMWGDRAVVGAPGYGAGVAHVFEKNPAGTWFHHTKLVAQDGHRGAGFGGDVAINGGNVFIGAPGDSQVNHSAGAVYVYRMQPGGDYTFLDKFTSPTAEFEGRFGHSVDANTYYFIAGAPRENSGGELEAGAAHLYRPYDSSFAHEQRIAPSSAQRDGFFGQSVDFDDGNIVAIGAPGYVHSTGVGYVRIYSLWNDGPWIYNAQLVAAGVTNLGMSVDYQDDFVVAGSPGTDFAGRTDCGAVALFERITGNWAHRDTQFGANAGDRMGAAVAVEQHDDGVVRIAVGQPGWSADRGSVVQYVENGAGLSFAGLATADSFGSAAKLGSSLVMHDEHLLSGAPQSVAGGGRPGRVLCRELQSGAWQPNGSLRGRDQEPLQQLGYSVALADGLLVVGSPGDDDVVRNGGSAWIFEQEEDGDWSFSAKIVPLHEAENGGRFGSSVATDGNSVVVGAPYEYAGGVRSGAAYVFRPDILGNYGSFVRLVPLDPGPSQGFGRSVAVAGNEVVVGAPSVLAADVNPGAVYVFRQNIFWNQVYKLEVPAGHGGDRYGTSLALVGTDLLAGAPGLDQAADAAGGAVQYRRLPDGTYALIQVFAPLDLAEDARYGTSVALSGDRAVVGAPGLRSIFVYERPPLGLFGLATEITGNALRYGHHVALDGDLIAVGSSEEASVLQRSDALWIESEIRGSDGGFDVSTTVLATPVAADGDLVLAGDPLHDDDHEEEGKAYLFRMEPLGPVQAYGFGNGSGNPCPCGNEVPTEAGCANSTGLGARLRGLGSTSLAAGNLTLSAVDLVPGKFAVLFAGTTGGPGAPFGDGLRVALGQVRRLGTRMASASGDAQWSGLPAVFSPGEVRYFQVLYRDGAGSPCDESFNLTNGVQVLFQP